MKGVVGVLRRRDLLNAQVEEHTPMPSHGLHPPNRAVDPQHDEAVNQPFMDSREALAARIRRGEVSVRRQGSVTKRPNLIGAAEIEVVEEDEAPADDPFATLTEWARRPTTEPAATSTWGGALAAMGSPRGGAPRAPGLRRAPSRRPGSGRH